MAKVDLNNQIFVFNTESRLINQSIASEVLIDTNSSINGVSQVRGQLQGNFNWALKANWEPVITGFKRFSMVQISNVLEGNPNFTSGIWKKRFFRGGDYLRINLDMRVVDFDSVGIVPVTGALLAGTMLPTQRGDASVAAVKQQFEKAKNKLTQQGTKMINDGKENWNNFISDPTIENFMNNSVDWVSKQVAGGLASVTTNHGGVGPVRIKIGQYFDKLDMIIESVNATYSKEFVVDTNGSVVGPLWGDFKITASTQSVESTDQRELDKNGRGGLGLMNTYNKNFNFVRNSKSSNKIKNNKN